MHLNLCLQVNIHYEGGQTPLLFAIVPDGKDRAAAVHALLKGGADPNLSDSDGSTMVPLIWTAYLGQEENAKLLIQAGADVNKCTDEGRTALQIASDLDHAGIVRMLMDAGAQS